MTTQIFVRPCSRLAPSSRLSPYSSSLQHLAVYNSVLTISYSAVHGHEALRAKAMSHAWSCIRTPMGDTMLEKKILRAQSTLKIFLKGHPETL